VNSDLALPGQSGLEQEPEKEEKVETGQSKIKSKLFTPTD